MDEATREKIESIVIKLTGDAKKSLKSKMLQICMGGDSSILNSAMIRDAISEFERGARHLIKEATVHVLGFARNPEAFELIHDSVLSYFIDAQAIITGGGGIIVPASTAQLVTNEFEKACERLLRSLQSYQSKFPIPKNQGGRPLAKEWYELMAHFVAKANSPDGLLTGKLSDGDPDRDISFEELEADMFQWFAENSDKTPEKKELKQPIEAILKALQKWKDRKN